MYQTLRSGVFTSKYLSLNTIYDISAARHCIRIEPYRGNHSFSFLRYCSNTAPICLPMPTAILKTARVKDKVFAVQADDTFYLLHPDFRGDPEVLPYEEFPPFAFRDAPDKNFFEEAEKIPVSGLTVLEDGNRGKHLPRDMRRKLGLAAEHDAEISVFDCMGRRWLEIRAASTPGAPRANDRLSMSYFDDRLSGITLSREYNGEIDLRSVCFGWDYDTLVSWYSETRQAVIVENGPVKCAVCGVPIRSIAKEHFYTKACGDCTPHLGADKAIDAIFSAQKAVSEVEEIVSKF